MSAARAAGAAAPAAAPAAPLQENARPRACPGDFAAAPAGRAAAGKRWGKPAEDGGGAPQRRLAGPGPAPAPAPAPAREFGTVVEGSRAPCGLAGARPSARWAPLGAQPGGLGPPGLDQGRKRPADASVYVDEEFREEHQHSRLAPRTGAGAPAAASAPATPAPAAAAPAAATPRHGADSVSGALEPAQPDGVSGDRASGSLFQSFRDHGEPWAEDADMEDKENQLGNAANVRHAGPLEHGRALRELFLDSPQEDLDEPCSDAESLSESTDFESENLAEKLAERVRLNADGWYDFVVYVDP